jgi:hypothetical protein
LKLREKISNWIYRVRKNHALEHATIHVLSQRYLNIKLVGRSDFWGFTLLGDVGLEEVASAATEALARLRRGEHTLAVHPRCGTNLALGAVLAGGLSWVALGGKNRSRLEKLPRFILASMGALLVAQPLGLWAQEHVTTTPDLEGVQIESVMRQQHGQISSYRVSIRHA